MNLPSQGFLSNMKMFLVFMVVNLRKDFIKTERFGLPPNQIISVIVYNSTIFKKIDVTLVIREKSYF